MTQLVIDLSGSGWYAKLTVAPPDQNAWEATWFEVTPLGAAPGSRPLLRVDTDVLYTSATNHDDGWPDWHVKIYRCGHKGDADALREHLRLQATALQQANDLLGVYRAQIEPPWAVVPVEVVSITGTPGTRRRTRPGAAPEEIVAEMRSNLPPWFGTTVPHPERFVFAVSPRIEEANWERSLRTPATQHLASFAALATGLDGLHDAGWAHCDIKPEHVCRYFVENFDGFAIVDTDSATQLNPAPSELRIESLYLYDRVRDRPAAGRAIDAGVLRAQDRFGFALVVLAALAGLDWVETVLLGRGSPDRTERRADSRDQVRDMLLRHWGPRWQPLVDVLAEPFGSEPTGQRPIEAAGNWAEPWIQRALEANHQVQLGELTAEVPADLAIRYRRQLARIRSDAGRTTAAKLDTVSRACDSIDAQTLSVAVRAAVGSALLCAIVIILPVVMVLSSAGWGK